MKVSSETHKPINPGFGFVKKPGLNGFNLGCTFCAVLWNSCAESADTIRKYKIAVVVKRAHKKNSYQVYRSIRLPRFYFIMQRLAQRSVTKSTTILFFRIKFFFVSIL